MRKKSIVTKVLGLALSVCLLTGCGGSPAADSHVKIGSLKGPTSIGLMKLMDESATNMTDVSYSFEMATAADELSPKLVSGELDVALVPANVASVLYNKSGGKVKVLNINTLGVLYGVSGNTGIKNVSDLTGKTVYVTNKGTTPDYCLQYLLKANGIALGDVNIEYKSEAQEVAALLNENPEAVGILPEPFVTALCLKNEKLTPVLDLTSEWDKVALNGGRMVTGVTVIGPSFDLQMIETFANDHRRSAAFANENVDETASLVVAAGIIEKEPLAKAAIPNCNITCIDGEEMKEDLKGYLEVLFDLDPASIGGALPGEDFYIP